MSQQVMCRVTAAAARQIEPAAADQRVPRGAASWATQTGRLQPPGRRRWAVAVAAAAHSCPSGAAVRPPPRSARPDCGAHKQAVQPVPHKLTLLREDGLTASASGSDSHDRRAV